MRQQKAVFSRTSKIFSEKKSATRFLINSIYQRRGDGCVFYEHDHVNWQIGDATHNLDIVIAKNVCFANAVFFIAENVIECMMDRIVHPAKKHVTAIIMANTAYPYHGIVNLSFK